MEQRTQDNEGASTDSDHSCKGDLQAKEEILERPSFPDTMVVESQLTGLPITTTLNLIISTYWTGAVLSINIIILPQDHIYLHNNNKL